MPGRDGLRYCIRTTGTRFSGVRQDGVNNLDASLFKDLRVRERARVQFRAEWMNALNHPMFSAPNTTPTSTAFGTITSTLQWPRTVQLALKITF